MGYPTLFQALSGTPHHLWSPDPPQVVGLRLSNHPQVHGDVDDNNTFDCKFGMSGRNSWRPGLKGTMRAAAGGTLIEVRYPVNPSILLFTLVHGILLFGISWIIGFVAYSFALRAARALMVEATGATDENEEALARAQVHEAADPTSPGADANAPLSFEARSDMNEATFILSGRNGVRTRLKVSSAGVELRRGDALVRVDWNDLDRVDLFEAAKGDAGIELVLETRDGPRYAPVDGHTEADQLWIATYLDARNRLWSETEEERLRSEDDLRRLAAVQHTRQGRES